MTAVFPTFPGLTFPVGRTGPIFDTNVQDAISGKQTAYANRVTPKWQWTLNFEFLRSQAAMGSSAAFTEMQTLASFFASCYGRLSAFAYTDQEDNAVTSQQFGVGDGISTAFQLVRTLGGLAGGFVEPVFLPVSPSIFIGGVLAPGTTYTIGATGIVTFTSPPAAGAPLTWTGSFNWLCRFDDDKVDFNRIWLNTWEVKKLSFTSVLV